MSKNAAIIGAGPSGLIAAEILSANSWSVTVYDHMPSVGRKFLMAGRGGLNLTHSEPMARFVDRYDAPEWVRPILEGFTPDDLAAWAHGLGQETFVGSSGRIFPKAMKASPLLRAWLARLSAQGVGLRLRHRWCGWDANGALLFEGPEGAVRADADATVLALGGGSWPKLGSDGSWTEILQRRGLSVAPLAASNCGVLIDWSAVFRERFEGEPLNNISAAAQGRQARGEAMITAYGLEGGAVYALSAALRQGLAEGRPVLTIDLRPDISQSALALRLEAARRGDTTSNFLRKKIGLAPVAVNLLRDANLMRGTRADLTAFNPHALAQAIKNVTLPYSGFAPITRAISSVGGLSRHSLDSDLRIPALGPVYAVGEMIDWDAPTGGYLLQLCFSSGVQAARRICGI